MLYLKCVLAGLGLALVVPVVLVVAALFVMSVIASTGSGGLGAVSFGLSEAAFVAVPLAFALGFWLMWRRERRKRGATH